ncbi:trypsin-like peptidase domain-containing protein [Streptomyces sp. NBC_00019]|uniref:trypsin-like peptidase domain-containing protein n=1 Tax=Streptomyces sp. NBC_00019 TaxID=2975623 RepID=UPI0032430438
MSQIRRLLVDCLVQITGPEVAGGTGFFIAPGTILTCGHVVTGGTGAESLRACWNGGSAAARIVAVHPSAGALRAPGPYPYPDLAVLEVERTGHPCVRLDLDEPRWEDRVHGCGYTRTWPGEQAQVEPVTFTHEGLHEVGAGLLKLAGGQAVPGMSGGPLLNLRTTGVCGVLKTTRDADRPTGGWGVPVGLLRTLHPELLDAHDAFHRTDRRWREAADAVTPMLAGLSALGASYAGRIENFLAEYLGRDGAAVPFGGRDPQLRELSAWLGDPQAHSYALIVAEAGRGKSALLVRWAQEVMRQEQAHVVVVPVSIRFNTAQAGVVFPALASRLGEVYGQPPARTDMSADEWKEACLGYLRRPPPGDRPLLVVLDGLDEATDWEPGPDLFPATPAAGVRVLASARCLAGDTDDGGWLDRLNWGSRAASLTLPPMDRAGVSQVLHSMGDPLAGLVTNVDVVSELYRLSEGDPLLVRLYVEALQPYGGQAAMISPGQLPSISKGLKGYFTRWWGEQERQWRAQNRNSAAERQDRAAVLTGLAACRPGPDAAALLHEALLCTQLIDDARPRIEALGVVAPVLDTADRALGQLLNDLVFRPGRLTDAEVHAFLVSGGVPLADGAVDAAVARVRSVLESEVRLAALRAGALRVSEQHRLEWGGLALSEAAVIRSVESRSAHLRQLAEDLPELRPRIDGEVRRALRHARTVEARLALIDGADALPGLLALAGDPERAVREVVVPVLTEVFAQPLLRVAGSADALLQRLETLYGQLPDVLPEELATVLWEVSAQAEPWLVPWLLVRLVPHLPGEWVPSVAARLQQVDFDPDRAWAVRREEFRTALAHALDTVYPRLDRAAQSAVLDTVLAHPLSAPRLRTLLEHTETDRLPDIVRAARDMPFQDAVVAAKHIRRYVGREALAGFLLPLVHTALANGPETPLPHMIGLMQLVDRDMRGALLDMVTAEVAKLDVREWPKFLRRLPAQNRRTVARALFRWEELANHWDLTRLIARLPAECLEGAEAAVFAVTSPSMRLNALGALIAAGGRPTPDRLWDEVLRTIGANPGVVLPPFGLLGLLERDVGCIEDHWAAELTYAIRQHTGTVEQQVDLLCALARHTRHPSDCALLGFALDMADLIVHDLARDITLLAVAENAAAVCPHIVERVLDAVVRINGPEGRMRAMVALVPAMQAWIGTGQADASAWDRALRQLSLQPRPLAVREMALLAKAGAGFLPDDRAVPRAFLTALHRVGGWWRT